jgi:hypothetical protein
MSSPHLSCFKHCTISWPHPYPHASSRNTFRVSSHLVPHFVHITCFAAHCNFAHQFTSHCTLLCIYLGEWRVLEPAHTLPLACLISYKAYIRVLFEFPGRALSFWSPPQGVSKSFRHPLQMHFIGFGQPQLIAFTSKLKTSFHLHLTYLPKNYST